MLTKALLIRNGRESFHFPFRSGILLSFQAMIVVDNRGNATSLVECH